MSPANRVLRADGVTVRQAELNDGIAYRRSSVYYPRFLLGPKSESSGADCGGLPGS